jgi:hypothetical protein
MALNKEIADLTSRVNQLERADQRRLSLEIKASGRSPPSVTDQKGLRRNATNKK